ncbi:hypothetical protein SAMN04488009_0182 [Maribacter sedimenticola]|uniref:Ig-like domain-containing protein n=1 Tax=Maribacter sedimenticola TaxID=228956 RepID=A0ABY1SMS5_9FLAO|nr:Ig-like domain-containing protein [Maribacter sedimenticola]SNR81021.1 hypothetical protein SAMN04488009_0182 [Maribacter sedimenticola]
MVKHLLYVLIIFIFISCSNDTEDSHKSEFDIIAPKVEFTIAGFQQTKPTETIVVSNKIEVNIDVKDVGGIAKTEAFINNEKVGEDITAPYQIIIDISSFTSKIGATNKLKNYKLKITATDNSGNIASQEQTINIDNELPVINEVTLKTGTIISGEDNTVVFSVYDNEGLSSIKTFVNNNLLSDIKDDNYTVALNTLALEDGENIFKIEALDEAENIAVYEVNFISDNTGPEIKLESISEGKILDTLLLLEPSLSDDFSEIVDFKISLNDVIIMEAYPDQPKPLEINPDDFAVGDAIFILTATDKLNNTTTIEINTKILRRLFTVQMDEGFLENTWRSFWVLVSEMDGSPITYYSAEVGDKQVVMHAPDEFPPNKEYMVSFIADENRGSWIDTDMTVVQNLTRENFEFIHFTPPYGSNYSLKSVNTIDFEEADNVSAKGRNFQIYYDQIMNIVQYQGYKQQFPENAYLIGTDLFKDMPYSYIKIENPWDADFNINKNDFHNTLVKTESISLNNIIGNTNSALEIWGYESEDDFDNDIYHELFTNLNRQEQQFGNQVTYYYPDIFSKYKHHFRLNQYNTIREGKPLLEYTIPNWLIGYTQNKSEIILKNAGDGHTVGRLYLTFGNTVGYQSFNVIYDSSKSNSLYIPQLPEVMSSLSIYNSFENELFEVDYSDLSSFDNISTYDEYIQKVIQPYKEHYETSKITDNIIDGNIFGISGNWGFKHN